MNFFRIMLGITFLLFSTQGFPQKEEANRDQSQIEKLYNTQSYSAALEKFNQQLNVTDASTPTRLLAESYRLIGDTYSAEHWYGMIAKGDVTLPLDMLYYAQALQSNGKYEEAKLWFLEYSKAIGEEGNVGIRLAEICNNAATILSDKDVTVRNMGKLNTEKLDFSPIFYKNGLVFTSTRKPSSKLTNRTDLWTNENFVDLFFAEVSADNVFVGKISSFNSINDKYHDGTASFLQGYNTMYFARSNSKNGRRKTDDSGVTRLKIYEAKMKGGEWANFKELPFNKDEFDSCHPSISANGSVLFFSSNRPGGYGGMDLYKCEKIGNRWSNPENLGPNINTEGNEVFPFIHPDKTLYFASNGLPGIGGLDIFSSVEIPDEKLETVWTEPKNLGKPINTNQDDFSLIVDVTGTKGYFTSNRDGGKGMDDIYSFLCQKGIQNIGKSIAESTMVSTEVCIVDFDSDEPLENVIVEIFPISNNNISELESLDNEFIVELKPIDDSYEKYSLSLVKRKNMNPLGADSQGVTNEFGHCDLSFSTQKKYQISLNKVGYEKLVFEFTYDEFLKNNKNCFTLKKLDCLKLQGKVVNKIYENGLSNSTITLFNKCTAEVEKTQTDANGNFEFCLDCKCDYEILASKPYFSMDRKVAESLDCNASLEMNFYLMTRSEGLMTSNEKLNNQNLQNGQRNNTSSKYSSGAGSGSNKIPVTINNYISTLSNNIHTDDLKVGVKMELKNIFYDFNDAKIREDAQPELEKVVKLLQLFPAMKIELQAHTDARGKRKYNQILSQKRADKAVEYIVNRGIDSSKIIGIGYGENVLKNNCYDQVDCTEEEHQKNRRTEIKIIAFDSSEIDVQFIDNKPKIIDSPNGRIPSNY